MRKLLTLGLLLLMTASVKPQTMTGWRITTVATWGFDSTNYPPAACTCYYAPSAGFGGDVDSMRKIATSINTMEGYGDDSLSRSAFLTTALVGDVATNPSVVCYWYLSDGQILRDNSPQAVMMIRRVDSLVEVIVSAAGTGAFTDTVLVIDTSQVPDDTLTNVRLVIVDFSRTVKADLNTGGTGKLAIAKLDNENLTFALLANWYFQETGWDTLAPFPAKDTNTTILVYKFALVVPASTDTCGIVIFTNLEGSYAEIAIASGSALQDTNLISLSPYHEVSVADVNGIIQFFLPRSAATRQKTKWKITVKDPFNNIIFVMDDYVVPDQTNDTLAVPLKN